METIRKLPVFLGAGAALLTGTVTWLSGVGGRECIARMAISMAFFFVVGLVLRNRIFGIVQEVEDRKAEAEKTRLREEEEERQRKKEEQKEQIIGGNLDLQAAEPPDLEGFSPGRVADFIRSELDNG